MIVKIWPVKADYAGDMTKVGGIEGLKNTYDYITDDQKVIDYRSSVEENHALDDLSSEDELENLDERNQRRVLNYMSNTEKIEGKYISGYLCDPDKAVSDFNLAKSITMSKLGRNPEQKETGAVAFHLVQSFPEGLDISDEEVHQCGRELCEKLNAYQAVICSHVHPVEDSEGEIRGKSKHNHILLNAYIHPDKLDSENPNIAKYHDCKETYAQLRAWNDEIAIAHGLPIIRNPDDDRTYSWMETDAINKGLSWKQRVRLDIQEAKRASGSWEEFVEIMENTGYKIKVGVNTSYTTPNNQVVRGHKLGKQYTKENLEMYWELRDYSLRAIAQEEKLNEAPPFLDVVLASNSVLNVAVPVGMKNQEQQNYTYIPLECATQSNETLRSYFNENELYDICDESKRTVFSAQGKEIIDCMEALRDGIERVRKEKEENIDFEEKRKARQEAAEKEKYYTYVLFINSRTKKKYRTSLFDENGRRRSLLELIFMLAIVVLKSEKDIWEANKVPPNEEKNLIYAPRDWKVQRMLDSIYLAEQEGLKTPAELEARKNEVGAAHSRTRSALKKTKRSRDNMEALNKAVTSYRKTEKLTQQILSMPEGPEKEQSLQQYKDILDENRMAKSVLYQFKAMDEDSIADFERRYKKINDDIQELEDRFEKLNEEYSKLCALHYNAELAQNAQFCYGPTYSYERLYQHQQEQENDDMRNKQAEKELNELVENSATDTRQQERDGNEEEKTKR